MPDTTALKPGRKRTKEYLERQKERQREKYKNLTEEERADRLLKCKKYNQEVQADEEKRLRRNAINAESARSRVAWLDVYKSSCVCASCGISDVDLFEFHHVDPAKKDGIISQMIRTKSIAVVANELAQCICLCANCHRKLHALEREASKLKSNCRNRRGPSALEAIRWVTEYKQINKCAGCGESDTHLLDMHHLDPSQKEACVSTLLQYATSIDKVKEEVEKCQVLCVNCHRKLHKEEYRVGEERASALSS